MYVKHLLGEARKRLTTVGDEALLIDAARALSGVSVDLVVVCAKDGKAAGVITKADVVRHITHCEGAACRMTAAATMTRAVISCGPDDQLGDVWSLMRQHALRNIPVIDDRSCPVGVVNARDALQALLTEEANEVELLREYVMGIGYQ